MELFLHYLAFVTVSLLSTQDLVLGQCPSVDINCNCTMQESVIRIYQCDNLGNIDGLPYLGETDDIIQVIQISSSTIRSIYNNTFAGLKTRTLDLRGSGIEHLDDYAFAGLESYLENLYLVGNEIQILPFIVFKDMVYLRTLTLDRNMLRIIVANQFQGLQRLTHLGLEGNSIETLEPEAFNGIDSLKYLYLQNNLIEGLPMGIFENLVNLEELNLLGNRIPTLHPDVFSMMPLLEQLFISNNLIDALPESVFDENRNLKTLDLDSNKISSELTNRHFVGPRNLEFLDLSFNNLTYFHPSTFHNMKKIKRLFLDNNRISKLAESTFEGLDEIEELYIQENLISALPTNSFIGMPNLRILDLSRNKITRLGFGIFDPFGLLQKLDISRNEISSIEFGPFITLRSLEFLDISWNKLRSVSRDWFAQNNWLSTTKPLRELALHNNAIRTIDPETFWPLKNLERLDISSNRIFSLNATSFRSLSLLEEINIHNNPFHNISVGLFSNLKQIRTLDISGTCLTEVVPNTFDGMTALEKLDLSDGYLSAISPETFRGTGLISALNISYNNLTALERPVFTLIGNSLEMLQLDHNALTMDGLADNLDFASGVKVLDISFNRLTNVYGIPNLKNRDVLLKMMGNPMECNCFLSWMRSYRSLADFEDVLCASPAHLADNYAVCYSLPNQCSTEPVDAMYVSFCANPSSVPSSLGVNDTRLYSVKTLEDYEEYCTEPEVPVTTAKPDVSGEEETNDLPSSLDINIQADDTNLIVTWQYQNNSRIVGYKVTCREFAENVIEKENLVLDVKKTNYTLEGLSLDTNYVVCVGIVLDDDSVLTDSRSCLEVSLFIPTTRKPADKIETETFPLMPVIGTCIAVVVVLVIILAVVILCLKRKPNKEEDEGKYMDERLRDKMGMWVNTFNYNGGVNEQIAEQTTVEVDIFSPVDVATKKNGNRKHDDGNT